MIKRDGVEVMNERTQNVKLAKETVSIIKAGKYVSRNGNEIDIKELQDFAMQGTILYPDHEYLPEKKYTPIKPTIEVVNETTAVAGLRLVDQYKDVVVLNFASARNQGGGFLAGAMAQEEDLCRASGLYGCLKTKPLFYNANIMCDDTFYTDGIIYSPAVPFFRDEHNVLSDDPFTLSVISAPAPNVRSMASDLTEHEYFSDCLYGTLMNRAMKILKVAETHGHKNIVLGAWGCGAFGNDAGMVAVAFLEALEKVPVFEHVCFAVYDTREPPVLYEKFKEIYDTVQTSGA